jgi:hypothetical protein
MRLFVMFFPIILLLALGLVTGVFAPLRRGRKHDPHDIDAVLDYQRQALREAREAAIEAIRIAREATRELRSAQRELEHLADLHQHPRAS